MDFSSAYNDGFYNASNHPNYNAFDMPPEPESPHALIDPSALRAAKALWVE
jgi:hypothetical protein